MISVLKKKYLIVAIFLMLYYPLQSQSNIKHNYVSHLRHNDPLIHNILDIEPINGRNFILAGKVKSILTKRTSEKNNQVIYSRKYYYNKDKRIERIIEYGENINDVELDKKYYRYGDHHSTWFSPL